MSKFEKDAPSSPGMGFGGCLVRLGWMLFGSVILLFSAVVIARHQGFLSVADGVFWAAIAACVGLRYFDVSRMHGQTASGEPSTLAHWRQYTIRLVAVGAIVWGVAHGISYLYG
jgi:hypothetical protein